MAAERTRTASPVRDPQRAGTESFDLCFRMIAGHDRLHLGQIGRALEVVRRS